MITLVKGHTQGTLVFPDVLTPITAIEKMFKNGEIEVGGIPPSHVTVKDSELYGHPIIFREVTGAQILDVSPDRDEIWISAQQYKAEHGETRYQTLQKMLGQSTAGEKD